MLLLFAYSDCDRWPFLLPEPAAVAEAQLVEVPPVEDPFAAPAHLEIVPIEVPAIDVPVLPLPR